MLNRTGELDIMAITALPTPAPSRTTQTADAFVSSMDNLLGALSVFVSEANLTAAAMNLNATSDTSATSNSIGLGAKTFTVTAGKSFQPGMYLIFADTAAPSVNSMVAQITSYSGTTLVVNSVKITGSGTFTAWTISFSAAPGVATGSGLDWLSTVTASASATVDIETTFDSTYDEYLILATGVVVATDNISLYLRMKIGGSYLTTNTYAYHLAFPNSLANAYNGQGLELQSEIKLSPNNSNVAAEPANLRICVHNPSSTVMQKTVEWQGSSHHATAPTLHSISGAGGNTGTAALTGIQILSASGNITSGTFRLYGIKKS